MIKEWEYGHLKLEKVDGKTCEVRRNIRLRAELGYFATLQGQQLYTTGVAGEPSHEVNVLRNVEFYDERAEPPVWKSYPSVIVETTGDGDVCTVVFHSDRKTVHPFRTKPKCPDLGLMKAARDTGIRVLGIK